MRHHGRFVLSQCPNPVDGGDLVARYLRIDGQGVQEQAYGLVGPWQLWSAVEHAARRDACTLMPAHLGEHMDAQEDSALGDSGPDCGTGDGGQDVACVMLAESLYPGAASSSTVGWRIEVLQAFLPEDLQCGVAARLLLAQAGHLLYRLVARELVDIKFSHIVGQQRCHERRETPAIKGGVVEGDGDPEALVIKQVHFYSHQRRACKVEGPRTFGQAALFYQGCPTRGRQVAQVDDDHWKLRALANDQHWPVMTVPVEMRAQGRGPGDHAFHCVLKKLRIPCVMDLEIKNVLEYAGLRRQLGVEHHPGLQGQHWEDVFDPVLKHWRGSAGCVWGGHVQRPEVVRTSQQFRLAVDIGQAEFVAETAQPCHHAQGHQTVATQGEEIGIRAGIATQDVLPDVLQYDQFRM